MCHTGRCPYERKTGHPDSVGECTKSWNTNIINYCDRDEKEGLIEAECHFCDEPDGEEKMIQTCLPKHKCSICNTFYPNTLMTEEGVCIFCHTEKEIKRIDEKHK